MQYREVIRLIASAEKLLTTLSTDDKLPSSDLESAVLDMKTGGRNSSEGLSSNGPKFIAEDNDAEIPTSSARTANPPIVRLVEFGRRIQRNAQKKYEETYPLVLDRLMRFLKLCVLTLAIIFVVMLASFIMALSHWFTVVFGHFFLRYTLPEFVDDSFVKMRLDHTMIFSAVGAFIVYLPPFITFLLSIPFTFDKTVLEGSAAPANEFIKRITPKNRYSLLFLKYAPRLLAGPIGCKIYWILDSPDIPEEDTLDPLHAFVAGVAGEVVLSAIGLVKNVLRKKKDIGTGNTADRGMLPM